MRFIILAEPSCGSPLETGLRYGSYVAAAELAAF
jgi:hypothetical protein